VGGSLTVRSIPIRSLHPLGELRVPGMQELVVIALVALFVLGPERLPEVMRAGGRLLTRVRNYGVTASKEFRGVADLSGLSSIEQEVMELRRELDRTRADLRRAMRETISSGEYKGESQPLRPHTPDVEPHVEPDTRG
jgi:sec-independent protein translocase protein TatB